MIADEICKDTKENWGRIVSLFVVGSILARKNEDEHHGKHIEAIIQTVGNYIASRRLKWIVRNGGWVGDLHALLRNYKFSFSMDI